MPIVHADNPSSMAISIIIIILEQKIIKFQYLRINLFTSQEYPEFFI
jgi:hypothetical protein